MQIPIINGIYTDEASDFRSSYPRNLIPVPKQQGISNGYLRPADGIVSMNTGPGVDRGAINWNGVCYRVMGTSLVRVNEDDTITTLGTIPGTNLVRFDYSFDRLSIAANGNLYYWNGSTLLQVTDPDLGIVIDQMWIDGHFMTTDGESLVVTELNDPTSVLPTKYGSSEVDPDPVKALLKLDNEPYALNRYTIEVFDNIGGAGFPFQRIEGAMIERGVIGTRACCVFNETIAFVGSKRNEPVAVWLGASGSSVKISTREIDTILQEYSETDLLNILVESRIEKTHEWLYIHLPDQTLVYDAAASKLMKEPVWFTLGSDIDQSIYRARNMVWCYNKWVVGDPLSSRLGYLTNEIGEHWGVTVGWEFGTVIIYNEGRGALFHELELVCLSGRAALGKDPRIYTEYSLDGESWSMPKFVKAGKQGERAKRIVWLGQGSMEHIRMQRFKGTSDARLSMARLEARIEGLN
jgi:hypothetical protein